MEDKMFWLRAISQGGFMPRIEWQPYPDQEEFWSPSIFAPPQPRIEIGIIDEESGESHIFTEQEQVAELEALWELPSPGAL